MASSVLTNLNSSSKDLVRISQMIDNYIYLYHVSDS